MVVVEYLRHQKLILLLLVLLTTTFFFLLFINSSSSSSSSSSLSSSSSSSSSNNNNNNNTSNIFFPSSSSSSFSLKDSQVSYRLCNSSSSRRSQRTFTSNQSNTLIDIEILFITPTYTRREQIAELTRLSQTLLHVPNLTWILVEDSNSCSSLLGTFLERLSIPYAHLMAPMPSVYLAEKYKPRGVSSRRAALHWMTKQINNNKYKNKKGNSSSSLSQLSTSHVFYFGDDDNTYDLRLFEELRKVRRVGMFPVGFIGEQGISSPIVVEGSVVGFTDDWFANRKFPVDMAGFAISREFYLFRGGGLMPYKAGYEEDFFLRSLSLRRSEIEPLASNCTEVLVWHTKTLVKETPKLRRFHPESYTIRNSETNAKAPHSLFSLLQDVSKKGMAVLTSEEEEGGIPLKICLKDEINYCDTIIF